jgi:4-hydroxyphenylpyruvate dioxygenase-like putative hemolysin
MQFFKIDEKKLYEKYFENMTVREFFELDHIPKNVEENHMRNMAIFLKKVMDENTDVSDIQNMTIGNIMINIIINNNMLDSLEN